MTQKKIPYGITNFRDIINTNCIFVDKTEYIEKLENLNEQYIFLLRPRKFGKSLFVSMLEHYYDINNANQFDQLFKDLYIHSHPTKLKNSYYVLHFNFSGIDTSTKENLVNSFRSEVLTAFNKFEKRYNLNLDYIKEGMPADIFNSFLTSVHHKITGKIYVFIDEYDHFANELLSFQTDVFEEVISKTGFVRKFYEVLKKGTEFIIQKIFATGVTPVTLDSLTSGFNIGWNLSRDPAFCASMGFDEDEVISLIQKTIGEDQVRHLPALKQYYNGYLFTELDLSKKYKIVSVYNSNMILYFLNAFSKIDKFPAQLIDTNIASDYSKMRSLFTLKNKEQNDEVLKSILKQEEQHALFTEQFSLAKPFSKDDFRSLLYYLGFLTIKGPSSGPKTQLIIPNYVIEKLYFDFFAELVQTQGLFKLYVEQIEEAIHALSFKNEIELLARLIEKTLSSFSNRDFIQFDEKYLKVILMCYLNLSNYFYVKSEYEINGSYVDIALLKRPEIGIKSEFFLELKYLKTKATKKEIEKKMTEAKEQLKGYLDLAETTKQHPDLNGWVLVVVGTKCYCTRA